jgi:hypothetical protein
MTEHREQGSPRLRFESLRADIQTEWMAHAQKLDVMAGNEKRAAQNKPGTEETVSRIEIHAERVRAGYAHFKSLYDKALDDLFTHHHSTTMRELFELATQTHFRANFLDGDGKDQLRADELDALEYTFYCLGEIALTRWQGLLKEIGILKKDEDIVARYGNRND